MSAAAATPARAQRASTPCHVGPRACSKRASTRATNAASSPGASARRSAARGGGGRGRGGHGGRGAAGGGVRGGRLRPPHRAAPPPVGGGVGDDPHQPGAEGPPRVVLLQLHERREQGVLRRVVRVV